MKLGSEDPLGTDYWLNVKFTSMVVTTSTGSPFNKVGLYTHCFNASVAEATNIGWPLIN